MSVTHTEIKEAVGNWTCPPEFLKIFAKVLTTNATDNTFNLEAQEITADKVPYIIEFLNLHPRITTLNISNNDIGDEGAIALARTKTIKHLYAVCCGIGNVGAAALKNNTTIKTLKIEDSFLENAELLTQFDALTEFSELEYPPDSPLPSPHVDAILFSYINNAPVETQEKRSNTSLTRHTPSPWFVS